MYMVKLLTSSWHRARLLTTTADLREPFAIRLSGRSFYPSLGTWTLLSFGIEYMDAQWVLLAAATLLGLYLFLVNRRLSSTPSQVQAISPTRYDEGTIKANYERLSKSPIVVNLPPKTGRRYIVVGGTGFLPGSSRFGCYVKLS